MKSRLLVILMLLFSTTLLMADRGKGKGNGYRNEMQRKAHRNQELLEKGEKITLDGKITLVNGEMPKMKDGDVTYRLMAPVNQLMEIKLKDGMLLTVEGVEMNYPPMQWDGKEKSILVTKIIINGEEFVIEHKKPEDFKPNNPPPGNGKGKK